MEARQRPPAVATSKDGDRQRRRRLELHTYMEVFAIQLDWEAHVIEKDPDDVKVPVGDIYKRGRKCDGCRLALGLEHRAQGRAGTSRAEKFGRAWRSRAWALRPARAAARSCGGTAARALAGRGVAMVRSICSAHLLSLMGPFDTPYLKLVLGGAPMRPAGAGRGAFMRQGSAAAAAAHAMATMVRHLLMETITTACTNDAYLATIINYW